MAFEIHGGVENSDDLKLVIVTTEKDHVFAFGGESASGKEVGSRAVTLSIQANGFEARPDPVEVSLLLLRPPGFQGVGADEAKVFL